MGLSQGTDLLQTAVWDGHTQVIPLLLEAKFDVTSKSAYGHDVLHYAEVGGHIVDIISSLERYVAKRTEKQKEAP